MKNYNLLFDFFLSKQEPRVPSAHGGKFQIVHTYLLFPAIERLARGMNAPHVERIGNVFTSTVHGFCPRGPHGSRDARETHVPACCKSLLRRQEAVVRAERPFALVAVRHAGCHQHHSKHPQESRRSR